MSRERLLVIDDVAIKSDEDSDLYSWVDEGQTGILPIVLENAASEERRLVFECDIIRIE